jgi:RNA methyltransferase, TrmH family
MTRSHPSGDDGRVTTIESPANPRIREALALRDREARLRSGLTLVDGARECRRAIEAAVTVVTAFVCRGLATSEDAIAALAMLDQGAAGGGPEIIEVGERVHDRLAYGNRRDGLVLVVRPPSVDLDHLSVPREGLVLVTEDVEKPGNLGAILRTADGAGCDAVIAVGGTDLFNPNVIRASIGTVFVVPVAAATGPEVRAWLRASGLRAVAASVQALAAYTEANLTGGLAFILGSEADGLSPTWHDPDIEAVRVPMRGVADSLNVSVTAAVLAFEARRQRAAAVNGAGEDEHA